jgi:hypothetical protein
LFVTRSHDIGTTNKEEKKGTLEFVLRCVHEAKKKLFGSHSLEKEEKKIIKRKKQSTEETTGRLLLCPLSSAVV